MEFLAKLKEDGPRKPERQHMRAQIKQIATASCLSMKCQLREVNRRFTADRDRHAMEKWVSAAASWTRAAELIDWCVAFAVQVGWLYRQVGFVPSSLSFGARAPVAV